MLASTQIQPMHALYILSNCVCSPLVTDLTSHFPVVLDRREDKVCDTGRFELAYKQVSILVLSQGTTV